MDPAPPGLPDPSRLPIVERTGHLIIDPGAMYADARPADVAAPLLRDVEASAPRTLPELPAAPAPARWGRVRRVRQRTAGLLRERMPAAEHLRAAGAGVAVLALMGSGVAGTLLIDDSPATATANALIDEGRAGKQDESLLLALDARDRGEQMLLDPSAFVPTGATTGTPGAGGGPLASGESVAVEGDVDLIKPVREAVEGSGFGMRFHPVLDVWKMHNGTDYPVGCGTPVYASAAGTVTHAQYRGPSGNAVEIDHGDLNGDAAGSSFSTHYFHLSAFGVRLGDHVEQGQFIGLVGTTGRSTGCHLHFEVIIDGVPVNPESVIGRGTATADGQVPRYGEARPTWSEPLPAEDERHKRDAEADPGEEAPTPPPAPKPAAPPPPPKPAAPPVPETAKNDAKPAEPETATAQAPEKAGPTPVEPASQTSPDGSPQPGTDVAPGGGDDASPPSTEPTCAPWPPEGTDPMPVLPPEGQEMPKNADGVTYCRPEPTDAGDGNNGADTPKEDAPGNDPPASPGTEDVPTS